MLPARAATHNNENGPAGGNTPAFFMPEDGLSGYRMPEHGPLLLQNPARYT